MVRKYAEEKHPDDAGHRQNLKLEVDGVTKIKDDQRASKEEVCSRFRQPISWRPEEALRMNKGSGFTHVWKLVDVEAALVFCVMLNNTNVVLDGCDPHD